VEGIASFEPVPFREKWNGMEQALNLYLSVNQVIILDGYRIIIDILNPKKVGLRAKKGE
jgi:hypothetical protein